jgi:hypothetical protein
MLYALVRATQVNQKNGFDLDIVIATPSLAQTTAYVGDYGYVVQTGR